MDRPRRTAGSVRRRRFIPRRRLHSSAHDAVADCPRQCPRQSAAAGNNPPHGRDDGDAQGHCPIEAGQARAARLFRDRSAADRCRALSHRADVLAAGRRSPGRRNRLPQSGPSTSDVRRHDCRQPGPCRRNPCAGAGKNPLEGPLSVAQGGVPRQRRRLGRRRGRRRRFSSPGSCGCNCLRRVRRRSSSTRSRPSASNCVPTRPRRRSCPPEWRSSSRGKRRSSDCRRTWPGRCFRLASWRCFQMVRRLREPVSL